MTQIYMDGGSLDQITHADREVVRGFTTNPSLLRKLGIDDYVSGCRDMLDAANELPVSIEVVADDLTNIVRQGKIIYSWGKNAWVKVPVINESGESNYPAIAELIDFGACVNVTAVMSGTQIMRLKDLPKDRTIISIFAGRIADLGSNPIPLFHLAANTCFPRILWASTRQIYDIHHATIAGADIITVSPEFISRMQILKKFNLETYSQETVRQFNKDARAAGYEF